MNQETYILKYLNVYMFENDFKMTLNGLKWFTCLKMIGERGETLQAYKTIDTKTEF